MVPMKEPYETLLGQYRDHWFLWEFLQGDKPDFARLAAKDPLGKLSTGELIMCQVALAFYNGDRTSRIGDLAHLDDENLARVAAALSQSVRARQ